VLIMATKMNPNLKYVFMGFGIVCLAVMALI
jgi:hypothetical protein